MKNFEEPVTTTVTEAMHFQRGLHYLSVRAAEMIVPIPVLADGSPDWRVVQEVRLLRLLLLLLMLLVLILILVLVMLLLLFLLLLLLIFLLQLLLMLLLPIQLPLPIMLLLLFVP